VVFAQLVRDLLKMVKSLVAYSNMDVLYLQEVLSAITGALDHAGKLTLRIRQLMAAFFVGVDWHLIGAIGHRYKTYDTEITPDGCSRGVNRVLCIHFGLDRYIPVVATKKYRDVLRCAFDFPALEEPSPSELGQKYAPVLYPEPLGVAERFPRTEFLLGYREPFGAGFVESVSDGLVQVHEALLKGL